MSIQTHALTSGTAATRLSLVALAFALIGVACSMAPPPRPTGTFLEEFEGFPIFHGEPERAHRVLGLVYDAASAERGISPMKRAAVKEAQRLHADAIMLGVPAEIEHTDTPPSAAPPPIDAQTKWRGATAIQWE